MAMRIVVLADVHNLFCSAKQTFQTKIDYARLKQEIVRDRYLVRAIAYLTSRGDDSQTKFIDALSRAGWEPRIKEAKILLDRVSGEKSVFSHPPTVEITMDAMLFHQKVDCVCLATGDRAYTPLATFLRNMNCKVELFGFERVTSGELQKACSSFTSIREKWCLLRREETPLPDNSVSSDRYNPEDEDTQPVVPNQPPATSLFAG